MPSPIHLLPLALVVTLLSTQATADPIADIFKSQDTNQDGAISVSEAQAAAPAIFRTIDRNNNGTLDLTEIAAHIAAEAAPGTSFPAEVLASVAQQTLRYWDGNGDGKVTEQEYTTAAVNLLMLADTNGDKRVTREELMRFRGEAVSAVPGQ